MPQKLLFLYIWSRKVNHPRINNSNAGSNGCGSAKPKPIKPSTTCRLGCRPNHGRMECRHQYNVPRGVTTHGSARCAIEAIGRRVPLYKARLADESNPQGTPHGCTYHTSTGSTDWARSSSFIGRDRHVLRPTEHLQRRTRPSQRKKRESERVAKCCFSAVCFNKVLLC